MLLSLFRQGRWHRIVDEKLGKVIVSRDMVNIAKPEVAASTRRGRFRCLVGNLLFELPISSRAPQS